MKQIVIALYFICFSLSGKAQTVVIQDGPFLEFMRTNYPTCFQNINGEWHMETSCSAITSETTLNFSGGSMVDLNGLQYFVNLRYLSIYGSSIFSTPNLPPLVEEFSISGSDGEIPGLNGNLKRFICSENNLFSLNVALPGSLRYFDCSNNALSNLPALPALLDTLICSSQRGIAPSTNLLQSLPALPATLKYLDCSDNRLAALPTLPNGLEYLNCSGQYYNTTPERTTRVFTSLPTLPSSLKYLNCGGTLITSLPVLPQGLLELNCAYTKVNDAYSNVHSPGLSSLPELPSSLRILNSPFASLTVLPDLPDSLRYLNIALNSITDIPVLPENLVVLLCQNNTIKCLPHLPASLGLSPAPYFSQFNLNIDENLIVCLPNSVSGMSVYASKPLCTVINNVFQCQQNPVIAGTLYYDNNSNGVRDAGENPRANVEVQAGSGFIAYSNINGYFELSGDTGVNTISIVAPTPYVSVPASASYNFSNFDTIVNNLYALQPTISIDSLRVSIISNGTPRPGFDMGYTIHYENVGTTVIGTNMQVSYDDANMVYVNASIPGVTNSAGVLTVPLINTSPGDRGSFSIEFIVNSTAVLGDTLLGTVSASVNAGSVRDSVFNIITGAYDPNDKNATPVLSPQQVSDGAYINYIVRFQNTGTDTAFNVVVTDQLESQLDASTFQMLEASHPAMVKRANNLITFEFLDIQLPDSNVNEPLSHGYIKFRVKPVSTVANGDLINNNVRIYFDYNAPVITNTSVTKILSPQTCFTISTSSTDALCAQSNGSITVTVSGGTAPFSYALNNGTFQSSPDFTALVAGTYSVKVMDATGCMDSVSTVVGAAGGFTATAASTPASCAGVNNGSITVTPNGGTNPYSYSLDGGASQSSETFTGLSAGPHTVVVTDAGGCMATVSVTISSGSGIIASAVSTPSNCGVQNGSITVTAGGGTAPYTYSLNGGAAQSSETFSNVAAGTYTVLVSDAVGCTGSLAVVVNGTPNSATVVVTQPTCTTQGMIDITGPTGTAPFQYSINGGPLQSAPLFNSLGAGNYVVLVQDANLCTYTETVTVNSLPGTVTPAVSITASAFSICEGDAVTFTATPTNGGSNPIYQWTVNGTNAGSNSATLTINPTVNTDVSVQLTSNDPCASPATATSNVVSVTVNPLQAPSITISGNTLVNQGASTMIASTISNGGSTPAYQWQDSTANHGWININGATSSSINYSPQQTGDALRCVLTVTGSCIQSGTIYSNELVFTVTTNTLLTRVYPNPATSEVYVRFNPEAWRTAEVIDAGGRNLLGVNNTTNSDNVRIAVANLPSGTYYIRLTYQSGVVEHLPFVKL